MSNPNFKVENTSQIYTSPASFAADILQAKELQTDTVSVAVPHGRTYTDTMYAPTGWATLAQSGFVYMNSEPGLPAATATANSQMYALPLGARLVKIEAAAAYSSLPTTGISYDIGHEVAVYTAHAVTGNLMSGTTPALLDTVTGAGVSASATVANFGGTGALTAEPPTVAVRNVAVEQLGAANSLVTKPLVMRITYVLIA
jgi:hypothetical protein